MIIRLCFRKAIQAGDNEKEDENRTEGKSRVWGVSDNMGYRLKLRACVELTDRRHQMCV